MFSGYWLKNTFRENENTEKIAFEILRTEIPMNTIKLQIISSHILLHSSPLNSSVRKNTSGPIDTLHIWQWWWICFALCKQVKMCTMNHWKTRIKQEEKGTSNVTQDHPSADAGWGEAKTQSIGNDNSWNKKRCVTFIEFSRQLLGLLIKGQHCHL